MFYRLPLIVLLPSCFKKLIASNEPIEYFLISVSCTLKKRILTVPVLDRQTLVLVILEQFKQFHVLGLSCKEEW